MRRRQMCTLQGLRDVRSRPLLIVVVADGTYVTMYALMTWLRAFAWRQLRHSRCPRRRDLGL